MIFADSLSHVKRVMTGAVLTAALAVAAPAGRAEPQGRCYSTPSNGQVLVNNTYRPDYGHTVEIENGTRGDAIIKIRNASSMSLQVAFYVRQGETASFDDLPDGSYVIQYAFGDALAADCKSFVNIYSADRFPGVESFQKTIVGDEVETDILSYTLYATPSGNVTPTPINPADFNKD